MEEVKKDMYTLFKEKTNSLSKKEIDALWKKVEPFSEVGPNALEYVNCWHMLVPYEIAPPNKGERLQN